MASKTLIVLQDDTDGSEASETIASGIDGAAYEIDLNEKHAKQLRSSLDKYVAKGRKVGSRHSSRKASSTALDAKAVRAWAASHKIKINDRGRVPADVVAQFVAAGN